MGSEFRFCIWITTKEYKPQEQDDLYSEIEEIFIDGEEYYEYNAEEVINVDYNIKCSYTGVDKIIEDLKEVMFKYFKKDEILTAEIRVIDLEVDGTKHNLLK